jgi:hypothetical protein
MLPYARSRETKPEPAAVTVLSETPAPKTKSFALVVVAGPLFKDEEDPLADAVTSTGLTALIPAYSCT